MLKLLILLLSSFAIAKSAGKDVQRSLPVNLQRVSFVAETKDFAVVDLGYYESEKTSKDSDLLLLLDDKITIQQGSFLSFGINSCSMRNNCTFEIDLNKPFTYSATFVSGEETNSSSIFMMEGTSVEACDDLFCFPISVQFGNHTIPPMEAGKVYSINAFGTFNNDQIHFHKDVLINSYAMMTSGLGSNEDDTKSIWVRFEYNFQLGSASLTFGSSAANSLVQMWLVYLVPVVSGLFFYASNMSMKCLLIKTAWYL